MNILCGDILSVESGFIFQSVNCQGVMRSGLAEQIRDKWGIVYDSYKNYCQGKQDFELLGQIVTVPVTDKLTVVNCFNQLYYGRDGKRYTDYCAVKNSLELFCKTQKDTQDYNFPFGFGAGLGGGDWNVISKIIQYYLPAANIWKLK